MDVNGANQELFNLWEKYLENNGYEVEPLVETEGSEPRNNISVNDETLALASLEFGKVTDGKGSIKSGLLTTEWVESRFEDFGNMIQFFMEYPDVLIDVMTPEDSKFTLFPYQRVSLRAKMRKKQVFETATRGASKSWGAFATRMITCMLVPGHQSFVVTNVKEQAVAIAKEKIQGDLFVRFPLLANEMQPYRIPGGTIKSPMKDGQGYASYRFTSGSVFDVVGVDSARGKRRHSGIFEEVIEHDQTKVNEKVIPLMNIARGQAGSMMVNPNEPFNSQQLYVTSAGFMGTFAYRKNREILVKSVLYPDDFMAFGIDYKVPMRHNLISPSVIRDIRTSPSFDRDSFEREYGSVWSGEVKGAAVSYNAVLKTRKKILAETKAQGNLEGDYGDYFYIMGADMAKDGSANTAISVIKVMPGSSHYRYVLVNGYIASSSDYEVVANEMKKTAMDYNVRLMVVDANGIGAAIRDWLNKPSIDKRTGEELPGFGIINPPKSSEKDVIKYPQNNIVYEVKANGATAGHINQIFFSRVASGAFKMLITHRDALDRYMSQENFQYLPLQRQQELLQPYQYADKLQEELLNLDVDENAGAGLMKIKRRDAGVEKDLFSATSYAIYACNLELENEFYKKKLRPTNSLAGYIRVGGGKRGR